MRSQGELPRQTVRALIWEIRISALPGSQRVKQDLAFPRGPTGPPTRWVCGNSLSLFWVVNIGLTVMYVEMKHTYCFFKQVS